MFGTLLLQQILLHWLFVLRTEWFYKAVFKSHLWKSRQASIIPSHLCSLYVLLSRYVNVFDCTHRLQVRLIHIWIAFVYTSRRPCNFFSSQMWCIKYRWSLVDHFGMEFILANEFGFIFDWLKKLFWFMRFCDAKGIQVEFAGIQNIFHLCKIMLIQSF